MSNNFRWIVVAVVLAVVVLFVVRSCTDGSGGATQSGAVSENPAESQSTDGPTASTTDSIANAEAGSTDSTRSGTVGSVVEDIDGAAPAGRSTLESARFATVSEGTQPGTMAVHIDTWGGADTELYVEIKTADGETLKGTGNVRIPEGINSQLVVPFEYSGDVKNLRFAVTDPASKTILDQWAP